MAKQKIDGIILGKGAINANTTSSQQFASASTMGPWNVSTSYPADAMVEYLDKYYRSLHATNLGNTPSTSLADWEVFSLTAQDGDVAFIVGGITSDIMIRNNGLWISLLGIQLFFSLADNTPSQMWLSILASVAKSATIEYTIDRGANSRRGTLRYESDGTPGPTGASLSDSNVVDIGPGDVGVTFSSQVDGTGLLVQLLADTDNQAMTATLKYVLRGWS